MTVAHHVRSGRAPARWAAGALLACFGLVFVASLAAAQPAAQPTFEFREWADRMGAYFDANPELKTTPSSGWKPYNRAKWFNEQRMVNGEDIPAGARWDAFLVKRSREQFARKNATATWFSLGPVNFAGRMLDIDFDPTNPTIMYAGAASGGIWKSTNSGLNWFPLDDELPTLAVGAVAVCPSDPNIILIGTGEPTNNIDRVGGVGILRSTDAGLTWSPTTVVYGISSGEGFNAVEFNAAGTVVLAAGQDSLWRSTDQGATWAVTSQAGSWTDIDWVSTSNDSVYALRSGIGSAGNRVRRSADGGLTWSVAGGAAQGLPDPLLWGRGKVAITPANSQYIYLHLADLDGNFMGLYRTTNGGTSWTLRNNTLGGQGYGAQAWYNNTLVADPDNAERVILGATPLFRSNNGGTSFSTIAGSVHVDHHAAVYRPGSSAVLWVGTDGGVYESTDDGTSWFDRNAGLTTYQFYDICVSQSDQFRAWGGTQDNGTDRWVNSTTWLNGLGADGMVCNGHPTIATTVYGEIQFGDHRKSINGGAGWSDFNSGIIGAGDWVTPVEIDAQDGNHLYTSANGVEGVGRGLYRCTNGASWVNVDSIGATSIAISPVNGDIVWSLQVSGCRVSTDDGATWNPASPFGLPIGSGTKILGDPVDANTVYATFSGYTAGNAHIVRSTDLGATWQDVTGDFPSQPVNTMAIDPMAPTNWFIGTDVGVWHSSNGGVNWNPYEVGFPNAVVADLEIHNTGRKLRAGTHGRGMWEVDITDAGSTGVPLGSPSALLFEAPAPNPLTNETLLRYAARRPGESLSLKIFDVQGRLVTNVAEHAADGIVREVLWRTNGVANGVYFALLRAGTEEKTQKLVVVK